MSKYRKKPVVIEAMQWTGENTYEVQTFIDGAAPDLSNQLAAERWEDYCNLTTTEGLTIFTLEDGHDLRAKHVASIGDWIIQGVAGEMYPCKPDIFAQTYEAVEDHP